MKGALILEFEKLREICGDYQQLNYAKGSSDVYLYAQTFTPFQAPLISPLRVHKRSILTTWDWKTGMQACLPMVLAWNSLNDDSAVTI
jgi:hypothetical protein